LRARNGGGVSGGKHFRWSHDSRRFQLQNALNAVAAARILQNRNYRITDENIVSGIARLNGRTTERLQTRPDVYLDAPRTIRRGGELAGFWKNLPAQGVPDFWGHADKAVDEVTGMLFRTRTK